MNSSYQYAVEVYDVASEYLGQVPIQVDWEPAEQWARFLAVQQGKLPPSSSEVKVSVQPIWHSKLGQPYTDGFQVRVRTGSQREVASSFEPDYFTEAAERASSRFVASARLKPGDRFKFFVSASPHEEPRRPAVSSRFKAGEAALTFPLREGVLENLLRVSNARGSVREKDIPVFIPQRVLTETAVLARQAGEKETGGILIGYLYRDPRVSGIFSVVTAQIPATHARGDSSHLEFTAEAWTDMQAQLASRKRGEIIAGWWHSHPVHHWCRLCPLERRRSCPLACGFLSADDRALHRTMFPHAYALALLVNDLAAHVQTHSVFGWRRGILEPRGFHVLDIEREEVIQEEMK